MPGFELLALSNWYDGNFCDPKIASIELIHHGAPAPGTVRLPRIAADGSEVVALAAEACPSAAFCATSARSSTLDPPVG